MAALVAAGCVLLADRNVPASLVAGAALGLAGAGLKNWRTGLAWVCCGWLAVGVFTWRTAARKSAERVLLESGGGRMEGR